MNTHMDKISKFEPYAAYAILDTGAVLPCAIELWVHSVFSRVRVIDLISISKYQTMVMQQFLKYCWYSIILCTYISSAVHVAKQFQCFWITFIRVKGIWAKTISIPTKSSVNALATITPYVTRLLSEGEVQICIRLLEGQTRTCFLIYLIIKAHLSQIFVLYIYFQHI